MENVDDFSFFGARPKRARVVTFVKRVDYLLYNY